MRKRILTSLVMASCMSATAYAECYGNVYSMNAGRGHVGFMVDLQEDKKLTGVYNGERALQESRALFSSSAMSYDKNTNRIYYVSVSRPDKYYMEGLDNETSDDEFASLDFHASAVQKNQLAYYDPETNQHTIVAEVPDVFRMAFNPATGVLFASDNKTVFTINTTDGSTTPIGNFSDNLRLGGFTSWGDFIFYENELLFVTNTRSFVIDTNDASSTLKSFHYINFVTGVTLDQNGQMLVSTKNQNVTGNVNSTRLWRLNPQSGEKVLVGLFPNRISAMATNTQETYTCYDETIFPSETIVEVTGVTGDTVIEGQNLTFTVNFDKQLKASKEVTLALKDGTAINGTDFSANVTVKFDESESTSVTLDSSGVKVTVPPGVTSIQVIVPTTDDDIDEEDKTLSLEAWIFDDQRDKESGLATIKDNDEPTGTCTNSKAISVNANKLGAWSLLKVDCDSAEVSFVAAGLSSPSARNTRLSWVTDFGNFSTTTYSSNKIAGYVGVTEVKTLSTLSINGSSTVRDRCYHGDVRGTPLSYVYNGQITFSEDGTPQCRLTLNFDYCDGADNRVRDQVTNTQCFVSE
ncbi:IPT/TIG domain-containing protein [Enterovibrio calviensis]|uniref:IPT/TIG domain-containing protein n=1 Tax=Enterovibrio calviensis TaxID=91359 RepID=UPI0004886EE2|nr:IPT/TIG domain-containing protein [Enterovibrio calviensis]